ncbi:non-structural maintenance of chromosomes element 4 homolog A-like [Dendronephthya gigantea]|uniref:non-structural maintenance of chromosomes element 4 homolog A-like n=1 Tax=Dendronephthya gigantea TaxID=151771 RepID=UPI001069EEBE|nr:non-structural maintenance of chromosomes element 4 homolog A-like [Dendronephthya gigantea]
MDEEDKYEDPIERRNLRFEYRQLITDTEQKRDEHVLPESDGLNQVLDEGNELFKKVRRTREAALDAQLLVLVSNLGYERAQHLQTGIVTFEPRTFAEKLITFMGGRRVDESDEEGNAEDVRLESLHWNTIGQIAEKSFRRTAAIEFMHGPVSMDAPKKKVKNVKDKSGDKPGAAAKITPQQLVKVDDNNEESTTKEVQRVYEALANVTEPGDDEEPKSVSFFKFVTNPDSFSQTVENIFHLSFLINKGNAAIEMDENGLPIVYLADPYSEKDYGNEVIKRNQVVMPFTMEDWRNIVSTFKIKKPVIPTRKTTQQNSTQDSCMEED